MDRTAHDALCRRNQLRLMLWADDDFAHAWLCHANHAERCSDGCDGTADPKRATFYASPLEGG